MNNGTHAREATKARGNPEPKEPAKPSLGVELLDVARALVDRAVVATKERPRTALGVALAVGFVLGGGLWTRSGRMILLTGVEYAARRMAASA